MIIGQSFLLSSGAGIGAFVALGNSSTALYSPNNGQLWNSTSIQLSEAWQNLAYGNKIFLAIGNQVAAYSTNFGQSWTIINIPAFGTLSYRSIVYGSGIFLALIEPQSTSTNSNYTYSSDNGKTWSSFYSGPVIQNLSFGGGVFLGFTYPYGTTINYSNDGQNWTSATVSTNTYSWKYAAYTSGVFVALPSTFYNGSAFVATNAVAYSADLGKTWTQTTLPSSQVWTGIAASGGAFVALAASSAAVAVYSTDLGKTWTQVSLPAGTYSSIAYGAGVFIVVGNGVYAVSKDNGATWTAGTLPGSFNALVIASNFPPA